MVGGVRSPGGKPKGGPFHPGGYRRGEDWTGELREPSECLVMRPLSMGSAAGCRDWLLRCGRRLTGSRLGRGEHRCPRGLEGALAGRSSCVRNGETPSGSWHALGVFGKPTVRRAQLPGGNRMAEKRMPVAERQQETIAADQSSS